MATANLTVKKTMSAKTSAAIYKVVCYALLVLFAIILIFPYVFMISKSLMTPEEAISPKTVLFPASLQWVNYAEILKDSGYGMAFVHTLEVILFNSIAVPLSATFVAFGFARFKFFGKNFLFMFMLSTMMLPAVVTQISLYVLHPASAHDPEHHGRRSDIYLPCALVYSKSSERHRRRGED